MTATGELQRGKVARVELCAGIIGRRCRNWSKLFPACTPVH